ncbi:MAG: cytochrome c-type biogenesis protein CcmH [Duodenibacillus sp.]|nr:cytochrome c-type biogenesis protein CcmH [Duodenibacillus sp.]
MRKMISGLLLAAAAAPAFCEPPAAAELRAWTVSIARELRAPGEPNVSLDESGTAAAAEIKARIYDLLAEGRSREEVIDYLAGRYGDQIRTAPRLTASTALLWGFPWLATGLAGLFVFSRRRRSAKAKPGRR